MSIARIKLPAHTNWDPLIDWHRKNKTTPSKEQKERYKNHGAKVSANSDSTDKESPHAYALMDAFQYDVSNALGYRVYPSYSFGWNYKNGSYFNPHVDTTELGLYCGIMIEQDAEWTLDLWDIDGMGKWSEIPTEVGTALVFDGVRVPHKRPPYLGQEAISMIFSYQKTPEEVQWTREYLRKDKMDIDTDKLLGELGISIDDFKTNKRSKQNAPDAIITIPAQLDLETFATMVNNCVGTLWHWIPAEGDNRENINICGPLMTEALELRNILKLALNDLEDRVLTNGKKVITTIPMGHMLNKGEVYPCPSNPYDDYSIYCPLDHQSAENWAIRLNGSENMFHCRVGQGIMVPGFPAKIELVPLNNSTWSRWISCSYREISDIVDA